MFPCSYVVVAMPMITDNDDVFTWKLITILLIQTPINEYIYLLKLINRFKNVFTSRFRNAFPP